MFGVGVGWVGGVTEGLMASEILIKILKPMDLYSGGRKDSGGAYFRGTYIERTHYSSRTCIQSIFFDTIIIKL